MGNELTRRLQCAKTVVCTNTQIHPTRAKKYSAKSSVFGLYRTKMSNQLIRSRQHTNLICKLFCAKSIAMII